MSVLVFEEIPEITDLLPGGGRPGFEYAFVAAQNVLKAQREGWDPIDRVNAFEIKGPLGSCPTMVLGKGQGVYGASVGSVRSKCWLDPTVSDLTGLWLNGEGPGEGLVPATAAEMAKPSVPTSAKALGAEPARVGVQKS